MRDRRWVGRKDRVDESSMLGEEREVLRARIPIVDDIARAKPPQRTRRQAWQVCFGRESFPRATLVNTSFRDQSSYGLKENRRHPRHRCSCRFRRRQPGFRPGSHSCQTCTQTNSSTLHRQTRDRRTFGRKDFSRRTPRQSQLSCFRKSSTALCIWIYRKCSLRCTQAFLSNLRR